MGHIDFKVQSRVPVCPDHDILRHVWQKDSLSWTDPKSSLTTQDFDLAVTSTRKVDVEEAARASYRFGIVSGV